MKVNSFSIEIEIENGIFLFIPFTPGHSGLRKLRGRELIGQFLGDRGGDEF